MKGALSSKPTYQFDAEGHLVKSSEDETPEVTFLRESIVLFVEGQSGNHPADVAACNDPAGEIPPEALSVGGTRHVAYEETVDEAPDETPDDSSGAFGMKRGRKSKY